MTASNKLELAAELAASLKADIALSKTREEHIRVTARANAAAELLTELTTLDDDKPLYEFYSATFTSNKDE
jgi:hypothetical protein